MKKSLYGVLTIPGVLLALVTLSGCNGDAVYTGKNPKANDGGGSIPIPDDGSNDSDDDDENPVVQQARLTPAQERYALPEVQAGSSTSVSIVLRNTGGETARMMAFSLGSSVSGFSLKRTSGDCQAAPNLAAGESCVLPVEYNSSSVGTVSNYVQVRYRAGTRDLSFNVPLSVVVQAAPVVVSLTAEHRKYFRQMASHGPCKISSSTGTVKCWDGLGGVTTTAKMPLRSVELSTDQQAACVIGEINNTGKTWVECKRPSEVTSSGVKKVLNNSASVNYKDVIPGDPFDIAVGLDHACVITYRPDQKRALWCWGDSQYEQLFDGVEARGRSVPAEKSILGQEPIDVDAYNNASCVLLANQAVYCVGRFQRKGGSNIQLKGEITKEYIGETLVKIAMSDSMVCVLGRSGRAYCAAVDSTTTSFSSMRIRKIGAVSGSSPAVNALFSDISVSGLLVAGTTRGSASASGGCGTVSGELMVWAPYSSSLVNSVTGYSSAAADNIPYRIKLEDRLCNNGYSGEMQEVFNRPSTDNENDSGRAACVLGADDRIYCYGYKGSDGLYQASMRNSGNDGKPARILANGL